MPLPLHMSLRGAYCIPCNALYVIAMDFLGPRGILSTRGEKEHTSKRVSIIACDNVISKAQLSGTPRDTEYPWGKGAHKQKSEHYRLR